jgi:hypothetical protein
MTSVRFVFSVSLFLAGCGAGPPGIESENAAEQSETKPNGQGHVVRGEAGGPGNSNPITYHGGPVILGTTNIYYIWYGNWTGDTAIDILGTLANNIGGSPYFNINTGYYQGPNNNRSYVSNSVAFAGSTSDNYSHGTTLNDQGVFSVVTGAIGSGSLPLDPQGVYFVLTSSDVNESTGFCTKYCGWHTHGTYSGTDIKFAFIGNAARCPSACAWQETASPNNNVGADGMASIIGHELEESVTDPDLNAWYDRKGAEDADKCAWTFGTTYTVPNGTIANMNLGGLDFLIQQNWLVTGGCALSL